MFVFTLILLFILKLKFPKRKSIVKVLLLNWSLGCNYRITSSIPTRFKLNATVLLYLTPMLANFSAQCSVEFRLGLENSLLVKL